jgi:tRNA (guanine-N7-)-methyltransferase
VRKPRRCSPEELLPYQWQMPRPKRTEVDGVFVETGVLKANENISNCTSSDSDPTKKREVTSDPLNWFELFGNGNPVEIEVGMGKGLFLLTAALAHPEKNYFGIEIARKYQLYAAGRFAFRNLKNVKTVCADARWVLRQYVPAASVAAVHVYFPDPWWKARHKKRRVFTPGFAAAVACALTVGGRLHIASDVEDYFGTMTEILRAMSAFRQTRSETNHASLEEAGYQTNFERKARQKGTPIWRAEFELIAMQFDPTDDEEK